MNEAKKKLVEMFNAGNIRLIGSDSLIRCGIVRPSWEEVEIKDWPPRPYAFYEGIFELPNGERREIHVSKHGDMDGKGLPDYLEVLDEDCHIEVLAEDGDEPLTEREILKDIEKIVAKTEGK